MLLVKSQLSIALLATGMVLASTVAQAEVIFKESFDDQGDWHGGMGDISTSSRIPARGAIIPSKWDLARIDASWAPSRGDADRHEALEILSSNADKARGGTGKSMVSWRDAHTPSWEFEPSKVAAGRFFKVRNMASYDYGETVTTTVTLNGTPHTYSITTRAEGEARKVLQVNPKGKLFADVIGVDPAELEDSNVIELREDTEVSIALGDYISSTKATGSMGAWNRWNSENLLLKRIGEQNEVYVEFHIAFSPEMYETYYINKMGSAKIFRIYSFTGSWEDPFDYFGGVSHPDVVWSLSGGTNYGFRNKVSLLGIGGNEGVPDFTRKSSGGDYSLSYLGPHIGQGPGGTDTVLPDKENGGLIHRDTSDAAQMTEIFGQPGEFTKVAFYVRMNSAKGVLDGVFSQWIDDKRIIHTERVNWIPVDKPGTKWNVLGIGGNDFFQRYPNYMRHEEWYSIDDIVVMDTLPENLTTVSQNIAPPNPPQDVIAN